MVGRQALEIEFLKGALRNAPRPRSATTSIITGLATWIDLLKADKRAFFTACSKAQAAADFLRGKALADGEGDRRLVTTSGPAQ
jgi:antirestriction protein ArdC